MERLAANGRTPKPIADPLAVAGEERLSQAGAIAVANETVGAATGGRAALGERVT
jgi:hypothetical protein